MSPHILEALIGGAIASIPSAIVFLVAFGSYKRMFQEYPPHRHEGADVIAYPKGFEPGRRERLRANGAANGAI